MDDLRKKTREKFLIDIRASGKTTELIYVSSKTGYPIVCANKLSVDYVIHRAKEVGIDIPNDAPMPVTVAEMHHGKKLGDNRYNHVLVDDADMFLLDILAEYLNVQSVEECVICNSNYWG